MPRSRPSDLWPWSAHQWGAARNPGGGDCTAITCSTTTHHPPRCPNDNPKKRVFLLRFDQHCGGGKVPIRPPGGRAGGPWVSGATSRWVYVVCHADLPFSTLCLPSTAGGLGGGYMPTASIPFPPSSYLLLVGQDLSENKTGSFEQWKIGKPRLDHIIHFKTFVFWSSLQLYRR